MIRRSTAGSSWKVRRGHRENREFQVPMEQTGKPVICTSNIAMTVGRHSPGTVVRILALISEHAWTMHKMILQVSDRISGRKSKARLEPKVIRVIRVRGLNRHLLHTRFQLPEQQFQLAHGLGLCHLHPRGSICGHVQSSLTLTTQHPRYIVSAVWEPMVQMAPMERVLDQ